MSNCSSAGHRIALSCSGQVCDSERQAGIFGKAAHQDIGQHIEPATRLNC